MLCLSCRIFVRRNWRWIVGVLLASSVLLSILHVLHVLGIKTVSISSKVTQDNTFDVLRNVRGLVQNNSATVQRRSNNDVAWRPPCAEERKNFVYIKTHKTGSETVSAIFRRFGYARNLSFVLPMGTNCSWVGLGHWSPGCIGRVKRRVSTSCVIMLYSMKIPYLP